MSDDLSDNLRASWDALKQFPTLDSLCDDLQSETPHVSRSACWKACLLFRNLDTTRWASISKASRDAFKSLQSQYLRNINNPDEVESFDDPLSEDSDVSRNSTLVSALSLSD
jgi:TBC1 domain family protein 5